MGFFIGAGGVLFALLVIIVYLIVVRELLKLFYNSKFYRKIEKEADEAMKELMEQLKKERDNGEKAD